MSHRESKKARYTRQEELRRLLLEAASPEWREAVGDRTWVVAENTAYNLLRRASRHHSLAENACNRELTPREIASDAGLERRISAALAEVNPKIRVHFDGDPRGYTVKIHFPPVDGRKPFNTWGGEETGWGI